MSNIPAHVASPSAREREAASRPVGVRGLSLASVAAYVLLFALTMYFLTPLYWLTLAATIASLPPLGEATRRFSAEQEGLQMLSLPHARPPNGSWPRPRPRNPMRPLA